MWCGVHGPPRPLKVFHAVQSAGPAAACNAGALAACKTPRTSLQARRPRQPHRSAIACREGSRERALVLDKWGAHRKPRPRLLLDGLHDRQRGHVLHEGQAHACARMRQPGTTQSRIFCLTNSTCWTQRRRARAQLKSVKVQPRVTPAADGAHGGLGAPARARTGDVELLADGEHEAAYGGAPPVLPAPCPPAGRLHWPEGVQGHEGWCTCCHACTAWTCRQTGTMGLDLQAGGDDGSQ